ncbi:mutator type transposase, partial [Tanacetum coccineum]
QRSALKKNSRSTLKNNNGFALNKTGVKSIKVGGTKGHYIYEDITCLWAVHISKAKDEETWTTIKPNLEVPIRALKDQLQKNYQLGVTDNKIYRAKAKASMKVLGDYTKQYALLRDYVLELQRTNPDTIKGFKAGMRDLLGLDGYFMKEKYPGQLLTAVGVDANHETYPLAYDVVEAETLNSWSWFPMCLRDDLDLTRDSNFTFMSDRQKAELIVICFNRQLVEGRDVPIITCLEFVRGYLMKRIVKVLWNGEDQYQVIGPYND